MKTLWFGTLIFNIDSAVLDMSPYSILWLLLNRYLYSHLLSTQFINELVEAMLVHVSGLSARIVTSPLTLGKRVTSQLPNLPPELRYIYYSKYFGLCVVPNICQWDRVECLPGAGYKSFKKYFSNPLTNPNWLDIVKHEKPKQEERPCYPKKY